MKRLLSICIISVVASMFSLSVYAQTEPAQPDAAALVNEVRQNSDWIHHVKSLRIHFEEVDKHDPRSVAILAADYKSKNLPDDATNNAFLRESVTSTTDVIFDGVRHRIEQHTQDDLQEDRSVWDGKIGFGYYSYKSGKPWLGIERRDIMTGGVFGFLPGDIYDIPGMDLSNADPATDAEDFEILEREKYRGVDCWRLATKPNDHRIPRCWFVGVADHRLYGEGIGYLTTPAEQIERFRKAIGKEAENFKTDAEIRDWFAAASEERRTTASYAYEELQRHTGRISFEDWYTDYAEVHPGIWLPKKHVQISHSNQKVGGGSEDAFYEDRVFEARVTKISFDEPLAEQLFTVESLKIPEGTDTCDNTHVPWLKYNYKEHFTKEEWQAILDAAIKRDADAKRAGEMQRLRKQHDNNLG